jgi:predicted nucleotidyltransferase
VTIEEVRSHRAEILALARQRGITAIRVFGSVARGDAHPGSDVDLLVDVEPGRSILAQAGFQAEVEALLGVPVHTLELPDDPDDLISSAALADAVPL